MLKADGKSQSATSFLHPSPQAGCINFSTLEVLSQILICCDAILCTVRCIAASLASTHHILVVVSLLPNCDNKKCIELSLVFLGEGGQNCFQLRTTVLEIRAVRDPGHYRLGSTQTIFAKPDGSNQSTHCRVHLKIWIFDSLPHIIFFQLPPFDFQQPSIIGALFSLTKDEFLTANIQGPQSKL